METIESAKLIYERPPLNSYSSTPLPLPNTSNVSLLKQQYKNLSNIASATVINNNHNSGVNKYASYLSSQQTSPPSTNSSSGADSGLDMTTSTPPVNSTAIGTPMIMMNNAHNNHVNSIIAINFSNLNLTSSSNSSSSSPNGHTTANGTNGGTQQQGHNNINATASLLFSSLTTPQQLANSINGAADTNKCLRCNSQVYSLERIGPIKGNIYHKTCFKCLVCDRQLDLKTYYTNQVDLNDRQIYCQSHAPKSGKGVFGADSIYIHNVLNAPKLDVMQKVDNKPKANIDGSARHIMHAMHAQHLFQMGNRKDSAQIHRFPAFPALNPAKLKAREELRKAQEVLEAKQRAEEDMLLAKFRDERAKEEQKLDKEVKEEWEKKLKAIQIQYENDLKRKRDQKEQKDLTFRLRKEQEDLEKNMTLKREKKREDAKRALLQMEQEATASLVTKHSEEMLKLIKAKELEDAAVAASNAASNGVVENGALVNVIMSTSKQANLGMVGERHRASIVNTAAISATPPPPHPPVRRKRDLYDDPAVFEYIDEQAINVAESEQTSYTELVDQLTYGLVTDLEKVRAIFRWITVKDLNAIEFGDTLTSDTPLGLLRGIKFGTETYHTLFMRLCSYAGMHCVDIKGHSKSVGYEPGMKIQPGKFTNTWNAVLIDGEWRFVQCNWGARHLVMSKDKKLEPTLTKPSRDKIKYQYDEHYFLPDPEEFILEFFPHNSEWQLLEQPITLEEFESLPFVRSLFFHYHLDFVNQRQAVIHTNARGACDIKLRMPEDLKSRLAFHFHLRLANREDNEINGVKLERYVLHTIQDDLVSFNVHVPQVGDYFIEIFASLVEPETNPFGQSFKLKCVCKYKIACEELTQRMHPLPACASGEWGPMKAQRHFNIVPLSHRNAIVETQQQTLELKFELPKLLKIHGKLHNNNQTDLDKLIKHETNQTPNGGPYVLTMYVQLPDEGQFGLDIYARDPDYQSEKRTMSHCCKYLLNYKKISNGITNGHQNGHHITGVTTSTSTTTTTTTATNGHTELTNGHSHEPALTLDPLPPNLFIGPNQELLTSLGMSPLSHTDPLVRLDDVTEIDLQFKMSKAVDFSFDLKYSNGKSSSLNGKNDLPSNNNNNYVQLKSSDIVKVKQYGYTICFSLNLPNQKYGNYLFTVYASDDQNRTKNLPAVYSYLIKYDKKSSVASSSSSSSVNPTPASFSFSNYGPNANNSPRLHK